MVLYIPGLISKTDKGQAHRSRW